MSTDDKNDDTEFQKLDVEEFKKWVASEEGQRSIKETLKRAKKARITEEKRKAKLEELNNKRKKYGIPTKF